MNTDTEEPQTKTETFHFAADGRCANPERVRVPMTVVVCHLLVAQAPWEGWFGGYAIGSPTVKYREQAVIDPGAGKAESRDEALTKAAAALEAALDPTLEQEATCLRELRAFVRGEDLPGAGVTPAEFIAKKHAEADFSDASLMDLCGRMEQVEEMLVGKKMSRTERKALQAEKLAIDAELTRREIAEAEKRAQTENTGLGAAIAASAAAQAAETPDAGPHETAAREMLAAEERDAAEPVAPVLPGLAHEANAGGVFENPELVVVPMPKRVACEILLAGDAEGRWVFGYRQQMPSVGRAGPAAKGGAGFASRRAALLAGLEEAEMFFAEQADGRGAGSLSAAEQKIAGRAAEAVFRFKTELAGEPEAAPAVRTAPTYRTEFAELPVAKMQENPENDRKAFNPTKDRELADSLLAEGLHQPIAVRKLLDGEVPEGEFALGDASAPEYELIFGHRRRRAAIIAGLATLQAKVYHGLARKQATAIALIENLQRENLNAMEEAEAYARLMRDEELTQDACAARVGRARSTVANAVRLLRLPEVIREYIREAKLTAEHGKGLARFVPDATDAERWRAEFPAWESVVKIMAEQAVAQKVPSAALDRGIPFIHALAEAGVAVRIDQFGEHRVNGKQRDHAAYYAVGDGDWVCFNPPHWQAEVAERRRVLAEAAEADRRREEETRAALAKNGRKQLRIEDLKAEDYRQFTGVNEALVDLVPDGKKQAAKGATGRTTVVTDVQLADRLQRAMLKEITANRREVATDIEAKARKKIASLKKVSPRELAWLVYVAVDLGERGRLLLTEEAHREAEAKFALVPRGALYVSVTAHAGEADRLEYEERRLPALGKSDPATLVRVLMTEYLRGALADVVANGPAGRGARVLRWWLDTDTLWLLEETEEGRAELVERVKGGAWYAKAIAGEAGEGGE